MSFPEEIDIDWINRWLDHGDKKLIAKEAGKDHSFVCKVLRKEAKSLKVLMHAKAKAKANEAMYMRG